MHTTKTQDSSSNTSPNQAHHHASLTHRDAKQKLTIGKRAQTGSLGASVSVTAFSGNPNSKGIIANRQAHPPSTITSDTSTA